MAKPNRRSNARSPRVVPGSLRLAIQLRSTDAAAAAGDKAPTEFRIFRQGLNPSEKVNPDTGLPWSFLFDDLAASMVMAAYAAYGKPLVLDYNHGTGYPFPSPEDAKAAGWFEPEIRSGELWACNIRWTDEGAAYVASGEYGLFSPWFEHDGADPARVQRLINCALTNLPALNQIDLLVAASNNQGDDDMAMEECKACATLNARLTKMEEECSALRTRLSKYEASDEETKANAALRADVVALTGQASPQAAMGALRALKEANAQLATVTAELSAIKTKDLDGDFGKLLDDGVTALKIAPAERAFWETQCRSDGHATKAGVDLIRGYLATATPKVIAATGGPGGLRLAAGAAIESILDENDREAARMLGNSLHDVAVAKAKRMGIPIPGATATA